MNEYKFADLTLGLSASFSVKITEDMMESFRCITGDINPLHADSIFAKSRGFDDKVAYGMLTASFISTLCGVYLPGKFCLIHSVATKFVKPVFIGDELVVTGVIKELHDSVRQALVDINITKGTQKVLKAKVTVGLLDG